MDALPVRRWSSSGSAPCLVGANGKIDHCCVTDVEPMRTTVERIGYELREVPQSWRRPGTRYGRDASAANG